MGEVERDLEVSGHGRYLKVHEKGGDRARFVGDLGVGLVRLVSLVLTCGWGRTLLICRSYNRNKSGHNIPVGEPRL